MNEIEIVLERIAAAAAELGPCRLGFRVRGSSENLAERLSAASGATMTVTVFNDGDGPYTIECVCVTRCGVEFVAQRPARRATTEEVAQLDQSGQERRNEYRAVEVQP